MGKKSVIGILSVLMGALISCDTQPDAQKIIDYSIKKHGGDYYNRMFLQFDFRGRHYSAYRSNGLFIYTREFEDSTGRIKDILSNDGFVRLVNGDTVDLPDNKANAYKNSVNSVIYFALLPYGLNDEAVNKTFIGEQVINGKYYYKIKVTFDKIGGGEDYRDIFVYWIDKEDYTMDYLAYLFFENRGGIRFREAVNALYYQGIIIADYNNYSLNDTTFDVTKMDSLYLTNQLKLLSKIDLENINIELLDNEP